MRQELKKHVGAIHACSKMSLLERKIANVLLLNAYDHLLENDEHSIRLRDLAHVAGYNSNDDEVLKKALRKLVKTTVEWNILDDQDREEWTVSTLLSRATIRKGQGVCNYAYDRELCKKLFHPDIYARINLEVQRRFKSSYALVLYENCIRFRRVKTTGWISLEDWRRLFGVNENQYKEFRDFSKRVLKPAISEVNSASDIHVEAEFKREQRKIQRIRFTVSDARELMLDTSSKNVSPLLERLQILGVSKSVAAKLLLEHADECIQRNLDYVEAAQRQGRAISNVGGFTVKAITEDFARAEFESRDKKTKNAVRARKADELRMIQQRAEESEKHQKSQMIRASFEALSDEQKESYYQAVLDDQIGDCMLVREYRKKGANSILFMQSVLEKFRNNPINS